MPSALTITIEVAWGVVSTIATIYFLASLWRLRQIRVSAIERDVVQAWRDYQTWAIGGLTISLLADVALATGVLFPLNVLSTVLGLSAILTLPAILLYGGRYLYKRVKNA